jgi:hypothetical protein
MNTSNAPTGIPKPSAYILRRGSLLKAAAFTLPIIKQKHTPPLDPGKNLGTISNCGQLEISEDFFTTAPGFPGAVRILVNRLISK